MPRRSRYLPALAAIFLSGALPVELVGASGPTTPRVVAAWAANLFEVRILFESPVPEGLTGRVVGRSVDYDEARPTKHDGPPATTSTGSRGSLAIAAARVENDRTLVLTTDPHPRAATYTLSLPADGDASPVVVVYDLTGVDAAWYAQGKDDAPAWSGWWPSLDPAVVSKQLSGPAARVAGFDRMSRPGRLTLDTLVRLPKGPAVLTLTSPLAVDATLGGEAPARPDEAKGPITFRVESTGDPSLLSLSLPTGGGEAPPPLRVTYRAGAGPEAPLPDRLLSLTWVPPSPPAPAPLENVPDLTGGDPVKGAAVFRSGEAKCANCHKVGGEGGNVGPDLSSLAGRDRQEVYRDIAEPSARIHPDYVPYTIAMKDGRIFVGTVRAEGADSVRVADTEAKVTVVPRAEVEEFRPGATSVMPVGLTGVIGEQGLRDLIAYLTAPKPH